MNTMDCVKVRDSILNTLSLDFKKLNFVPTLAVVVVGDDNAGKVYLNSIKKIAKKLGVDVITYIYPIDILEEELIKNIQILNNDNNITSILIEMPLPNHISFSNISLSIAKEKDVDCIHPENIGLLLMNENKFTPCTPKSILSILDHYEINLDGKHCVIIGRSNIVGKPLTSILLERNATVTICHSKTIDIGNTTNKGDIIISAVGIPNFVTKDMVKNDAIVIDVGINRDKFNKVCGDVDFINVKDKCSYITSVPKGVGCITVTMLMKNVLTSCVIKGETNE